MLTSSLFRRVFELDVRSLGVFRVLLGILLLYDLASRGRDFTAHYTDAGLLPVADAALFNTRNFSLSLHLLSGEASWQGLLMGLAGLAALGLVVGVFTRWMTILSWVLLVSLHNRNPLVTYGGDQFLSLLLLWSMFLPLGARFSIDRLRSRAGLIANGITSMASAGLILQVCLVYFFSFLSKTGESWWDGSAVYYALSLDAYTSSIGRMVLAFPGLLKLLTYATLGIEVMTPLLLLLPSSRCRNAGLVVLVCLQIGFALFMELGLFPWVSMLALVPLVPKVVWGSIKSYPTSSTTVTGERFNLVSNYIAAVFVIAVLLWNVGLLFVGYSKNALKGRLPSALVAPIEWFHLDQSWSMFSPEPPREDGWFVVEGVLSDGTRVDLLKDGTPLDESKPVNVARMYSSDRWKEYYGKSRERGLPWKSLVDYLAQEWKRSHPRSAWIVELKIGFFRERTTAGGTESVGLEELYRHVL